jgi:hypothetical protein
LEDVLEVAIRQAVPVSIATAQQNFVGCRAIAVDSDAGIVVCRAGAGFLDDDIHYIRLAAVTSLTTRVSPAEAHHFSFGLMAPPPESSAARQEFDRLTAALRDQLRQSAGYQLSLVARAELSDVDAGTRAAWYKAIADAVGAVCALEPVRKKFQMSVDQIMLRTGENPARLGGSTLFLEAAPGVTAESLKSAIEILL